MTPFEKAVQAEVTRIRSKLQEIEDLSAFEFIIKATGRVHDGHVKISYEVDHPHECNVGVVGATIEPVLEEYMRRLGWNERNAPKELAFFPTRGHSIDEEISL